jgi:glycosyltransferase involved in cell wall biosynthesis
MTARLPMRIAVDARELCGQPTGVGRYLAHLLDAWDTLAEARGHEFLLYAPQPRAGAAPAPASRTWRVVSHTPGLDTGTLWEQITLPLALRRDRPDVLFAPAYTAPLVTRVPIALTLHDLSFAAHPEWFPWRSGLRRRVLARLAARRARVVITDAEFSRAEVVRLLEVPAQKVRVIPLGLTAPAVPDHMPRSASAPRPLGTVLFVGSIFNRRHLPELIQAFAIVRSRHPELRLEIVGDNRTYPPVDLAAAAVAAGVASSTHIRAYVPDDVLGQLYRQAGAFVFLSDYEGFGLTPLEAMQAGVPVLAGDTPVAREVYGDAAQLVNTLDVPSIAAHLERLLFAPDARAALLAKAPAVLARYSWERTARETLAALVEAAHG